MVESLPFLTWYERLVVKYLIFTQIKNYPVQSFATADIVPIALLHIDGLLKGMKSCIVNTVHDSIVIDVHPDEESRGIVIVINETNK